jgi:uncharacterized protein (TIGR03435 family)
LLVGIQLVSKPPKHACKSYNYGLENQAGKMKTSFARYKVGLLIGVMIASVVDGYPVQPQQDGFEVASVKRSALGTTQAFVTISRGVPFPKFDPIMYRDHDQTLALLVERAFSIAFYQIVNQPSWFQNNLYDIQAKCERPSSYAQQMMMLQTLLVRRFQLRYHIEEREMLVYDLIIAKGGPKLRQISDEEAAARTPRKPGTSLWRGTAISFADSLSHSLLTTTGGMGGTQGLPVLDKTGLKGSYDFTTSQAQAGEEYMQELGKIMEKELGLSFVKRKERVTVMSIDHASPLPTDN